jgi:hypothetical protein
MHRDLYRSQSLLSKRLTQQQWSRGRTTDWNVLSCSRKQNEADTCCHWHGLVFTSFNILLNISQILERRHQEPLQKVAQHKKTSSTYEEVIEGAGNCRGAIPSDLTSSYGRNVVKIWIALTYHRGARWNRRKKRECEMRGTEKESNLSL